MKYSSEDEAQMRYLAEWVIAHEQKKKERAERRQQFINTLKKLFSLRSL